MTIARFKDLCMDAADPFVLGRFWADALGGHLVDLEDGDTRIDPRAGERGPESIWVNRVPEPRTGRTRVQLTLCRAEPGPLIAAGATILRDPGADPWWELADPDGNIFRVLPSGGPAGIVALTVESLDPAAQAAWWAGVVGGRVEGTTLVGAAGYPWAEWRFAPASGPRTVKNRIHWDVDIDEPEPDSLVKAGATVLREKGGDISWFVMHDPEGNEFCAFPPR